jgi:hypothetical protein
MRNAIKERNDEVKAWLEGRMVFTQALNDED